MTRNEDWKIHLEKGKGREGIFIIKYKLLNKVGYSPSPTNETNPVSGKLQKRLFALIKSPLKHSWLNFYLGCMTAL